MFLLPPCPVLSLPAPPLLAIFRFPLCVPLLTCCFPSYKQEVGRCSHQTDHRVGNRVEESCSAPQGKGNAHDAAHELTLAVPGREKEQGYPREGTQEVDPSFHQRTQASQFKPSVSLNISFVLPLLPTPFAFLVILTPYHNHIKPHSTRMHIYLIDTFQDRVYTTPNVTRRRTKQWNFSFNNQWNLFAC